MKNDVYIQQKVEAALQSIEGIRRAEVAPFFHTRLVARMENQLNQKSFWLLPLLKKPVFAVVTLSLFAIINLFAIVAQHRQSTIGSKDAAASIESVSNEYDINVAGIYQDKN